MTSPAAIARRLNALGVIAALAPDAAAQCPTSALVVDAALHTPAWSDAIAAARETLRGSDRPWHCAGAIVRFAPDAAGALVLEVSLPSGTTIRRHLRAPAELSATLQAALIVESLPALEVAPPPTPAPPAAPLVSAAQPATAAVRPRAPSAFVDGVLDVGVRAGGTPSYVSFALRAAVAFRIRAWSLFAWGRVEPATQRLEDRGPGRYLLDIGALGLGGTWGATVGSGRLEAGVSLATNSYTWRDRELLPGQKETFVQVRVGALARWRSHARGVGFAVTLDADIAPATVAESSPPPPVPAPPAWSAGLMLGASYGGAL